MTLASRSSGAVWFLLAALALFSLLLPSAAHAKWFEASSDHFVVYADESEKDVRRFSEQLERYHAALTVVTGTKLPAPSPSNRVTVYVVRNDREVRELNGGDDKFLQGFYVPQAGASLAIVPKIRARNGVAEWSMIILLHEYAHHFLMATSTFPVPRWLSEGGAEFFASAGFKRDGSVEIGRPAVHRAGELLYADEVTAEELLDPDTYEGRSGRRYDAFYGRSWLLYHYLTFGESRAGQLQKYIKALIGGKSSREAALRTFGDFAALDKELNHYMRGSMKFVRLSPDRLKIGEIRIRRLRDGEAEMMPVRIRSKRGVTEEEAAELVVQARAIAAKYPHDPAVLAQLAETEYDSGNPEAAVNAADASLALDPGQVNAYVQKGYALFELARDAPDRNAAYLRAREPFIELNRLENDHPIPLIWFYRSFIEMGRQPTENAKAGLEWASRLAPFDLGLRMQVAQMEMREGHYKAARFNLTPIAYNPHGGEMAEAAKALLASIRGKAEVAQASGN